MIDELRALLGATYRLERELGGGGMSRVFIAEEIALGRRVVLKVLAPELASAVSAERFEREVRVAARLQHPHIVPLLATGRVGDVLFYTMPLVEGESLRTRLDRQGELPVADAVRLLREVADALAYAHSQGVVHRDIKPDNLLLSHGHAMVTDFGIARAVSEAGGGTTLTQTGVVIGTPAYMAPEQATGDAFDHRADIYAFGVVAYEMLAGVPPFRGSTVQALVAAHLVQDPTPLSQSRPAASLELSAIVHRCLQKRASDRFQGADLVVEELDRVIPTGERRAGAASDEAISRRSAIKGMTVLGLVGAGLAGGVGIGTFVGARVRRGDAPTYHRLTFRRGLIRTARFGPDFQTVYYGALWDGEPCRVFSARPESPESAPLALPPGAPLAASSAGELALALGTHARGIMTYGTLARVPVTGGAPRELQERVKYADWSPDGKDLLVARRVGARDRLEFPLGTVLAEPEDEFGGFSFPRVSPRGDAVATFELLSPSSLTGRVVILDRSGARRAVSRRFFNVFGLAWRGEEVWFTAADELPLSRNAIYAMRPNGDIRIVARVPGNASLHDIAPDGRLLIARTDDRSGITARVPGEATERDLSWLDATNIAGITADGRHILFTESGVGGGRGMSVYLRGTDGSTAVRLGDGEARAISPDGRWAIVSSAAGVPYFDVIPTGAGQGRRLERPGLEMLAARWLRNDGGENVIVLARAEGAPARLYALDIGGTSTRPITPANLGLSTTGWAVEPGGSAVAVTVPRGIALYSTSGEDAAPARLVPSSESLHVVGWIRSGLLASPDPSAGGIVLRVDPSSGRRDTWADLQPRDPAGIMNTDLSTLVVSPDGRGYAYTWHRAVSDLYVADGLT